MFIEESSYLSNIQCKNGECSGYSVTKSNPAKKGENVRVEHLSIPFGLVLRDYPQNPLNMDFHEDQDKMSVCSHDDDDENMTYVQDYVDDKRVEDFLNLLNPENEKKPKNKTRKRLMMKSNKSKRQM